MPHTNETYVEQISALAGTCKKTCGASALFYCGDENAHGLRIECITIMKEFLDNVKSGSGRLEEVNLNPV